MKLKTVTVKVCELLCKVREIRVVREESGVSLFVFLVKRRVVALEQHD